MQLIIGGNCQGKLEFTLKISGLVQENVANASLSEEKPIINQLHSYIYEAMKRNEAVTFNQIYDELYDYIKRVPNVYLICDEVGCGIIPMDALEREYREMVGRILCRLVPYAERVYRVFCGIGVKIKDDTDLVDTSWNDGWK